MKHPTYDVSARLWYADQWWRMNRDDRGAYYLESISVRSMERELCWAFACYVRGASSTYRRIIEQLKSLAEEVT